MRKAFFISVVVLASFGGVFAAPPQVREVPFPYWTIQAAIDAANDGDTVVVHPGEYAGAGNRGIDFKGKAITVRSEDPEEPGIVADTIIDVRASTGDPNRAFIFQTLEDANSILDGFTIINGLMIAAAGPPDANGIGGVGGDSMGGAILCIGTSPIIRNCIINDCIAEGGTGGAGTPGEPGIPPIPPDPCDPCDPGVPGVPPTAGTAGGDGGSGYGGGIYCDPNSSPTILNCLFNSCSALQGAGGDGGAGGAPGDPNEPEGPSGEAGISDANGWGGGICVASGSTAVITDCSFYDCNAIGGTGADDSKGSGAGGGIFFGAGYSGTLVADMTACEAVYGGGVVCETDCNLAISDSSITEGLAFYGASIYCDYNCVLEISDCNLSNGVALVGGGICCAPECTATIRRTNISNMVGDIGGGIFFAMDGNLTLSDCDIQDNLAVEGGGIRYDTGGPLKLAGCRIINNIAEDGIGGGILAGNLDTALGTTVVAGNCTISNNTALYGAGMCLLGAMGTINDCIISENTGEYGGGAYWYASDVNIANCTVSNNVAAQNTYCSGGGLYCLDSTERMEHCVIENNYAQGFGGGVYVVGPNLPGGVQEMTNCLVTQNSAGLDGGGLSFNVDSTPVISNCTIAGNFVEDVDGSGGGMSCYDAFAEITDSIFSSNVAAPGRGREIAIGDPLEVSNPPAGVGVFYSDVVGGEGSISVSTGCSLTWDANNLTVNPLFVDGFHLSQIASGAGVDSPCVDAGSDTSEAKELHRRSTRTDSGPDTDTVDMGYHYVMTPILCDCDFDGIVDMADLGIMFSYWLDGRCELSYDCDGADVDLDHDVNGVDFAICAGIYSPVDKTPPTPNPSLWGETPPTYFPGTPNSVVMRAAPATDPAGVEYRFICTSGGGNTSAWQDSILYIDSGLAPGTYSYRCQARDKSPQQNQTTWSEEGSATVEFGF